MNIPKKLALKSLKLNKKRSIGTIIGIILATALICTITGMGTSLQASLLKNSIDTTGYYHLSVNKIEEDKLKQIKNSRDVKNVIDTNYLGTSFFEPVPHAYSNKLDVESMSKENFDKLSYKITDGRFPTNDDEIALTSTVLSDADKKIGDTIELNIGEYSCDYDTGIETIDHPVHKTYKIVGVLYKNCYYASYYGVTPNDTSKYFHSYIILENPNEYKTVVPQLLGLKDYHDYDEVIDNSSPNTGFSYSVNKDLLRWEAFDLSDSTVQMLCTVIGIVLGIIIITSVVCIRNSFAISTQEKKKMYGMLSSIGATKRQIRSSVLKEASVLATIGIPLGIALGVLSVYILTNVCNLIIGKYFVDADIVFNITLTPIIISILLGILTIYFSALGSARKTSKVSPIMALRENNEIKISSKELKTPKIISKCFKTGGVIAYKNLKRNKKKYRTTVISLTISITLFIVSNAFATEMKDMSSRYYADRDYNIMVGSLYNEDESTINQIASLPNTKNPSIIYISYNIYNINNRDKLTENVSDMEDLHPSIVALDDVSFQRYAKKLNVDYEKNKSKGILVDKYKTLVDGKEFSQRAYTYSEGDIIEGNINGNPLDIEISKVSDVKPYTYEDYTSIWGFLVVDYDEFKDKIDLHVNNITLMSDNSEQTVQSIESIAPSSNIYDIDKEKASIKAVYFLVNIFLYGFITIITLIGVTNIFNTITSTMELRKKEFAMLKSIGMTKKEFKRMINLETIMYSIKSLIYGVILGTLGSLLIHKAYNTTFAAEYQFPLLAVLISIIGVTLLIHVIMRYSMKKIEKQNIIETIRNDNI